jgi:hypothetical protein
MGGADPIERYHRFGDLDYAAQHEHVLHGLLTSQGMLTLAAAPSRDVLAARIVERQIQIAYQILLATERALRCIPSAVRRRIYALAFNPRALADATTPHAPPPVAMRLLARVRNGPPDQPARFRIHAEWVIDVPCQATINDFKRQVHLLLWGVNLERPFGDRASDSEMETLSLDLGVHEANRGTRYLSGTRRISQILDQPRRPGELPTIYVIV